MPVKKYETKEEAKAMQRHQMREYQRLLHRDNKIKMIVKYLNHDEYAYHRVLFEMSKNKIDITE